MIPVQPAPAPEDFEQRVRGPGRRALLELTGDPAATTRRGPKRKRRYPSVDAIPVAELDKTHYWTAALPDMRERYRGLCAYLAMRIHPATGAGTIDHFVPKTKDKWKAYEWANFRLATQLVNTYKGDAEDVLDPFEIEAGWFVLDLGDFEVKANPKIEAELRRRVHTTAYERLRLNEPHFCATRRYYHDRYHGLATELGDPEEPWPLSWLEAECPFVAMELRRQGRLRPPDR